jgi:cob(I)alamin adenosyltransferase
VFYSTGISIWIVIFEQHFRAMFMEKSFKIYTKTGDDGTSGLIGGTRVEKNDERLEAYGTIDELNAHIGVLRSENTYTEIDCVLELIQNKLFIIGSHLATDISKSNLRTQLPCNGDDIVVLETEIDRMQEQLQPLANFVLPGGSRLAAQAHIARTVCRRAERRIVSVSRSLLVDNNVMVFVNRLSDYLFVLSRYYNYLAGKPEVYWKPVKS